MNFLTPEERVVMELRFSKSLPRMSIKEKRRAVKAHAEAWIQSLPPEDKEEILRDILCHNSPIETSSQPSTFVNRQGSAPRARSWERKGSTSSARVEGTRCVSLSKTHGVPE